MTTTPSAARRASQRTAASPRSSSAAPTVFVQCAGGQSTAEPDLCIELQDGNCGWTAECALPEPGACTLAECGENPGFIECPGGELAAIVDQCTTLDGGTCGWIATGC